MKQNYQHTRLRFEAAKRVQTDRKAWAECTSKACKAKQSCLGGPRGTCKRTGGWPFCTAEGKERIKRVPEGKRWNNEGKLDEETPAMAANRRAEERLANINEMLAQAEITKTNQRIDNEMAQMAADAELARMSADDEYF